MTRKDLLTLTGFVVFGVLTRTLLHIGPNFEFVTVLTLLAATKLKQPYAVAVPLFILIISDTLLGNSTIFLFTWSGFLVTYLIGTLAKGHLRPGNNLLKYVGKYEVLAIVSVLAFYLWTNFGVVVTTTMYADTLAGYGQSLVMALPFLKNQLLSAVLTTGVLVGVWEIVTAHILDKRKALMI